MYIRVSNKCFALVDIRKRVLQCTYFVVCLIVDAEWDIDVNDLVCASLLRKQIKVLFNKINKRLFRRASDDLALRISGRGKVKTWSDAQVSQR